MKRFLAIAAVALFVAACNTTAHKCAQGGPFGSCLRYSDDGGAAPSANDFPGSTGSAISGVR